MTRTSPTSVNTVPTAAVSDGRAVDLLHRMVAIPSVSGQEGELARFVVGAMTELGFEAHVDDAGNAVGVIGAADGPTIMLLGHLDTVPGGPPVRLDGDKLYGRGSVDAKGPLATMIVAAARARAAGARIVVVGAVDEERDSVGAHYVAVTQRADAVVIGEPSGVGTVVVGYKGVLRFTCSVDRPQAHTSSPDPNASEVAAAFWEALRARYAVAGGRVFDQLSPTLVSTSGDLVHADLVVSCRTPLDFDTAAFLAEVRDLAGDAQIRVLETTPAIRRSRADPVARALAAAVREHTGGAEFKLKLGTSDMNVLGPAWQVPIATYGPGDPHLDHTPTEHVDLSEYLLAVTVLTDAVGRLATDLMSPS
ncbi:M20/M25/M40 family metallo-hydrolase [Lentzea sp. NPDC042327]|uniref:M20/M25/M40 family metallo-hydrolase n=1 Tax=Lentzea sp. NPDC042327 TaxID=3154801 RepID=UPI0034094A9C